MSTPTRPCAARRPIWWRRAARPGLEPGMALIVGCLLFFAVVGVLAVAVVPA